MGLEGQGERTRKARPKSAGHQRDWNLRWCSEPRTFEVAASDAPPEKQALFFGPQYKSQHDKIVKLLAEDLELRKQESEHLKDGQLRRKEVEAGRQLNMKNMKPGNYGGKRLFSDVPLLGTSESAVNWYMQQGDAESVQRPTSVGPESAHHPARKS